MTYYLYDDGNEIMQCTDETLCDAVNWIYDNDQGYIINEKEREWNANENQ